MSQNRGRTARFCQRLKVEKISIYSEYVHLQAIHGNSSPRQLWLGLLSQVPWPSHATAKSKQSSIPTQASQIENTPDCGQVPVSLSAKQSDIGSALDGKLVLPTTSPFASAMHSCCMSFFVVTKVNNREQNVLFADKAAAHRELRLGNLGAAYRRSRKICSLRNLTSRA